MVLIFSFEDGFQYCFTYMSEAFPKLFLSLMSHLILFHLTKCGLLSSKKHSDEQKTEILMFCTLPKPCKPHCFSCIAFRIQISLGQFEQHSYVCQGVGYKFRARRLIGTKAFQKVWVCMCPVARGKHCVMSEHQALAKKTLLMFCNLFVPKRSSVYHNGYRVSLSMT